MYDRELMGRCKSSGHVEWKEFKKYAEDKEAGQSHFLSHIKNIYAQAQTGVWSKSSGISSMS
jgi:hypothetical protein